MKKSYLHSLVHPHSNILNILFSLVIAGTLIATASTAFADADKGLKVGDAAPDFELKSLMGKTVKLSEATKEQPVVLVVLRGWPGYQCPICTKQVGDFCRVSSAFAEKKAPVIFVYPGPEKKLEGHAQDFMGNKIRPLNFTFLMDPGFTMIDAYHLRWNASHETAYPSTFIIDRDMKVRYAKISSTHGDRSSPEEVLKALDDVK